MLSPLRVCGTEECRAERENYVKTRKRYNFGLFTSWVIHSIGLH